MRTIAGAGCLVLALGGSSSSGPSTLTCAKLKDHYKKEDCCGNPEKDAGGFQLVPNPKKSHGTNPCYNKKPTGAAWDNADCFEGGGDVATGMPPQAGGEVTLNFEGNMNVVNNLQPRTAPYWEANICPVNVHWHLGAEHKSVGEYDENGRSPEKAGEPMTGGSGRYGFACHKFNQNDAKFTKEYDWKHCLDMHVGETYEVHWPHSALGMCHTPWQFQEPFYDGVFCNYKPNGAHAGLTAQQIANNIGVQAQVFTIVNDEDYYYPNLMWGMIVDGELGKHITKYTGSTTGTSRNNTICSQYGPITWQVDRKCHLISASTFDKMCADMKQQRDDLSKDLHPHGARQVVSPALNANNQVPRL